MKKYHQLLLFITTVVSLSLLLVYRHEYNRLHYVLEVFNFFGQSCNISDLQYSENTLAHHDWGVEPLWQESEDIYIYSSFWNKKAQAETIVLQVGQTEVAKNCYLWFEDKYKPIIGKFKYSKFSYNLSNNQNAYIYYCMLSSNEHDPYAVSFSIKNRNLYNLKKIMLTVPTNSVKYGINTTICVSPTAFNKRFFIEFISYHKLIGVDSFIFYGNSVPHRFSKVVTNLATKLGIKVAFLMWNYPKSEGAMTRKIVEKDCLMRTASFSQYSITLEIDEFIVPSQHYSFNEVIKTYNSKELFEKFGLPVQTFCIQKTQRHKLIVLQNTNIYYNNNNNDKIEYVYQSNRNENLVTQAVIKGLASIHKYVECIQKPERSYQDTTILKFSTDLIRSSLVQFYLHDQI